MEFTEKQKNTINRIKSLFVTYFDGGYQIDPISSHSLSSLRVTDLEFNFDPKINEKVKYDVSLTVTLGRPGLLIGMGGRTLNELEERFSTADEKVKILIKESRLWDFIK
jgi:ribosomal protein S3